MVSIFAKMEHYTCSALMDIHTFSTRYVGRSRKITSHRTAKSTTFAANGVENSSSNPLFALWIVLSIEGILKPLMDKK